MISLLLSGLIAGCLYALIALGVILIFRTTRSVNFAQGDIGSLAPFVILAFTAGRGLPPVVALVVGLLVSAAAGLLLYLLVVRPLERRNADLITAMVATLAVSELIRGVLPAFFGYEPQSINVVPSTSAATIGGYAIPVVGVGIIITTVLTFGLLAVVLYRTRVGLVLRMGGSSTELTALSGVEPARIGAIVWVVSALVAGWAFTLFAQYQFISVPIVPGLFLAAIVAASAGAFRQIGLTVAGAIVLAILINVVTAYTSLAIPHTVSLVVLTVIFLVLQRIGKAGVDLHGGAAPSRIQVRPLLVRSRRLRIVDLAVPAAALALYWFFAPAFASGTVSGILSTLIALVAVALAFRYGGRLNLTAAAHFAVGSYTAAMLAPTIGAFPAMLVGLVACGVLGLLVGAVTARMHTIYYVQLGILLSASAPELISAFPEATGGVTGIPSASMLTQDTFLGGSALVFVTLLVAVGVTIAYSTFGRSAQGARAVLAAQDARVAWGLGLSTRGRLIGIEAACGVLFGLSGVLKGAEGGYLTPGGLGILPSIILLTGLVLGGGWSVSGLTVGAVVLVVLPQVFGTLSTWPPILFGLIVLGVVMFAPQGVEGLAAQLRGLGRRRKSPPAPPEAAPVREMEGVR